MNHPVSVGVILVRRILSLTERVSQQTTNKYSWTVVGGLLLYVAYNHKQTVVGTFVSSSSSSKQQRRLFPAPVCGFYYGKKETGFTIALTLVDDPEFARSHIYLRRRRTGQLFFVHSLTSKYTRRCLLLDPPLDLGTRDSCSVQQWKCEDKSQRVGSPLLATACMYAGWVVLCVFVGSGYYCTLCSPKSVRPKCKCTAATPIRKPCVLIAFCAAVFIVCKTTTMHSISRVCGVYNV